MSKTKRSSRGQLGCGFMLATCSILTILLIANSALVRFCLQEPLMATDERIFQAAQFVLPMIMIFFEYWVYDRIFNRVSADPDA